MDYLYAVVDKETGAIQFDKAYGTQGSAKLALKNRISRSEWSRHAIASIRFEGPIVSTVDSDGVWTEVNV